MLKIKKYLYLTSAFFKYTCRMSQTMFFPLNETVSNFYQFLLAIKTKRQKCFSARNNWLRYRKRVPPKKKKKKKKGKQMRNRSEIDKYRGEKNLITTQSSCVASIYNRRSICQDRWPSNSSEEWYAILLTRSFRYRPVATPSDQYTNEKESSGDPCCQKFHSWNGVSTTNGHLVTSRLIGACF